MKENKDEIVKKIPVVCTRGIVVFPNQEIVIDVGREKSIQASTLSQNEYLGEVLLVAQKDMSLESPNIDDLCEVGTLCLIKRKRKMYGYERVKFRGLRRVLLKDIEETSEMIMSSYEDMTTLHDEEDEEKNLLTSLRIQLENLEFTKQAPTEIREALEVGMYKEEIIDYVSQVFPLNFEKRQHLLEMQNIKERMHFLCEEVERNKGMMS